ncbi:glutamate racemase [Oxalobacteraceae bacterium GrIS 2.11]
MNQNALQPRSPVGIFDSGVGGLSVLRHIREQLPNESLCYFADSGFAPYGDKPETEIMQRTLFAAQSLLSQGVKAIVVACNTATAAAIALLRSHYPDLILVGVEPGLKPAASLSKTACAGVLATRSTLASAKYQLLCEQVEHSTQVRFIHQACPGLVNQIERGELDSPATLKLLEGYLQPIFDTPADVLVLGCTHYPFVEASIRDIAKRSNKGDIRIIDTGLAIARQLERLLTQHQLLNLNPGSLPITCTTSGQAAQLEFGLTRLLKLQPGEYTIQEIGCNLPLS